MRIDARDEQGRRESEAPDGEQLPAPAPVVGDDVVAGAAPPGPDPEARPRPHRSTVRCELLLEDSIWTA